jgi:hypothetical protein
MHERSVFVSECRVGSLKHERSRKIRKTRKCCLNLVLDDVLFALFVVFVPFVFQYVANSPTDRAWTASNKFLPNPTSCATIHPVYRTCVLNLAIAFEVGLKAGRVIVHAIPAPKRRLTHVCLVLHFSMTPASWGLQPPALGGPRLDANPPLTRADIVKLCNGSSTRSPGSA